MLFRNSTSYFDLEPTQHLNVIYERTVSSFFPEPKTESWTLI